MDNSHLEQGLSQKDALLNRNLLTMSFRNVGNEMTQTFEDKGGQYLTLTTPAVVCTTLWTSEKMVQVVSSPSSRKANGEFKATVRELDPVKFWAARSMPHRDRPEPGQEHAELNKPAILDGAANEDMLGEVIQKAFASPIH